MIRKHFFFIPFLLILHFSSFAQKGAYIQPYYLLQYTQIANQNDYLRHETLKYETTYNHAVGLSYIHNFSNIFGLETGLKYAKQGQKYSGFIDSNYNEPSEKNIDFKSELMLDYIMVPFLFKFNSVLDDDKIYLSIGAGIQFDFLQSVDIYVNPEPVPFPESDVDLRKFYKNFTVSFISNAYFNYHFTESWSVVIGFQMFRSMGNIEDYSYPFDKNRHPVEYNFPISVKKAELTPLITRKKLYPTKNISYSMLVGINYKIIKE